MAEPVRSLDRLSIPNPCEAEWESMIGNDQVRFCNHCNLHVTNLSSMTQHEAMRLVVRSQGRLCVRYVQTASGRVMTKGSQTLHQIGRRVSRIAAGAFTATLSLSSAGAQTETRRPNEDPSRQVANMSLKEPPVEIGATVSGTVFNPNREIVPGAIVTLFNAKTYLTFIYSTQDDGTFKFSYLEPGKYILTVDAPAFAQAEAIELDVRAESRNQRNVQLQLPSIITAIPQREPIIIERKFVEVMGVVAFLEPSDPLVLAAHKDDLDAVRQLMFTSPDVNKRDGVSGMTALEHAIQNGNLEIVRALLVAGARANLKDNSGRSALMHLREKATADLVRELISAGAKVNARDKSDRTPLINAASFSSQAAVKELIESGAKIDLKDYAGRTALMFAASEDPQIVKLLIDAGSNINLKDEDGRTALMFAAEEGQPETVRLLISYGAQVNDRDDDGCSALMLVASTSDEESVQILLNAGADLTFKDKEGSTALALARKADQEAIVRILVSRGAPE